MQLNSKCSPLDWTNLTLSTKLEDWVRGFGALRPRRGGYISITEQACSMAICQLQFLVTERARASFGRSERACVTPRDSHRVEGTRFGVQGIRFGVEGTRFGVGG